MAGASAVQTPLGRRKDGTNQRALGINPRALKTNPRALGTNPKALLGVTARKRKPRKQE